MGLAINGAVLGVGSCRVLSQVIAAVQVARWANGSWREPAAAIGADVAQHLGYAIHAERALEGADACVGRSRWQIAVAVFAGGSKFEHGVVVGEETRSPGYA